MDVFTRFEGQRLVISCGGQDVIIEITNAEYGRARLAVIAPAGVMACNEETARQAGFGERLDLALDSINDKFWATEHVSIN